MPLPTDADPQAAASALALTSPAAPEPGHALPIGTRLRDYEITGLIGAGAFAIVYLAFDHSLQRKVAIKEYAPSAMTTRAASGALGVTAERDFETYKAGLKSFVSEARLLARFDHPSLVKVYRFWEENGTAYMVMPYVEGPTLKSALAELGHVPGETELRSWLRPVLNAVTVMHEAGCYHQHIGPDNIRLTPTGPVLLDFAAARRTVEAATRASASLKPGFAALEQYGNGASGSLGAWTDLYALSAVVYSAITATTPPSAPDRVAHDSLLRLRAAAAGLYSDRFLQALDAALAVHPEARPRDHAQFRALMGDIDAPNEAVALSALRDLMLEPFVVDRARSVEITVPDLRTEPVSEAAVSRWPTAPVAPGSSGPSGPATRPPISTDRGALSTQPASEVAEPSKPAESPTPARDRQVLRGRGKWLVIGLATFALFAVAVLRVSTPSAPAAVATPSAAPNTAAASAGIPVPAQPAVDMAAPALSVRSAAASSSATRPPTLPEAAPPVAVAPVTVAPVTAITRVAPARDATLTAAARQARCVEILQKVSLEPMTPLDSDFYKRECQ